MLVQYYSNYLMWQTSKAFSSQQARDWLLICAILLFVYSLEDKKNNIHINIEVYQNFDIYYFFFK